MKNRFNINEEEKNRIRGLHLTESKDLRFTSVLNEAGTPSEDDRCITIEFESGSSDIEQSSTGFPIKQVVITTEATWGRRIDNGMLGDRPFLEIEASVSGPGSADDNERVINERVIAALDAVLEILNRNPNSPSGLPYSAEALKNKAIINKVYGTEELGSILDTGERVPTDPTDEYFKGSQYVKICLLGGQETPNIGMLANQFMAVTMEETGTNEDVVYDILDQLRDEGDFMEFNEELKSTHGMDFYEIACDFVSVDLNPLWPGETEGPAELGMDDTTINAHLRRLGVDPIDC